MEEYKKSKQQEFNLMAYNIPESEKLDDLSNLKKTLRQLPGIMIKKVFRMGKIMDTGKPRSVKVIMDSPSSVPQILKNKNLITPVRVRLRMQIIQA
ncbi:hypothetical protein JTB14_026675 [Gonioctena quinquepunctata]|nr:hypothetical protein JTB14_026675 [Gonioctena quinquepunctata]